MDANSWKILFQILLSLYFVIGIWKYYNSSKKEYSLLFKIVKGRSEVGSNFNFNEFKTRTYVFILFLSTFIIVIWFLFANSKKDFLQPYTIQLYFFFFLNGAILMTMMLYYKEIKIKMDYYKNIFRPNSNTEKLQESKQNLKDIDLKISMFQEIENIKDLGSQKENVRSEEILVNETANIKVLKNLRIRSIIPLSISKEEIMQKCAVLKEGYNLYCDESDLGDLLLGKKLNKKILFINKDKEVPKMTISEYLALIDIFVNGNLINYRCKRKNLDIIEWIDANFDYSKIKATKLISKNISDYRDSVKAQ